MKAQNWGEDNPDLFWINDQIFISPAFWTVTLAALLDGDKEVEKRFVLSIGDDGCWAVALRLPDQVIELNRPPSCVGVPARIN
jgi:hypothetical protein